MQQDKEDNTQSTEDKTLLTEIEDTLISEDDVTSFSKTQLAEKLQELLLSEEIQPHLSVVREIKSRFDELVRDEYQQKLRVFMQDGSLEEDFSPRPDPLDKQIEQSLKTFGRKKTEQHNQKEKSALENLSTKNLILEELKELLKGKDNFSKSYNKFQALQSKWRATGNIPQKDIRTLSENYHFLTGKFYDIMKISNELRELDRKKNLELKTELCEKAEHLAEEPSLKKSLEALHTLQETWHETGLLTRELNDSLTQRFKVAADKILERKKEHIARLRQEQVKNLAAKTALCEQLETLPLSSLSSYKLCHDASEKTESIWAEWQKIGFVPKSDNGACWIRFKKARKQVYDAIDLFYAEQRKEFGNNLLKKTELCIRAEALQDNTDWASTAETLKRLQREWKTLGQVARKDSEPIWNRFRKACDHFFGKKEAEVLAKENTIRENAHLKDALILKIEAMQPTTDINQNFEELKKVQEEWTALNQSALNTQNNNFGKAIESFLEKIRALALVDDKILYRMKYEQMLKHPQGQEKLRKMRFDIQDKMKALQAEVNQLENNLSFFGKSKKANPILEEYQQKLEKSKTHLKELSDQLKAIPSVN